jgi:tRNA nucleotidyltransferase (CCA-adding enzyme)
MNKNQFTANLTKKEKSYFHKLSYYLDTKLYYYGSVTRDDYVPNKSDIDMAIFTDNEHSTMSKLQHFLHAKRNAFDKIAWKLNGQLIYGYKIKCMKYSGINCEIAIYNNEFKSVLIEEYNKPLKNQTLLIYVLLNVLKILYYQIPLLPTNTFLICKRYILNDMIGKKENVFYLLKQT